MHSDAATPKQYIDLLPDDRRRAIRKVRATIRKHLPRGYVENMAWGMIAYSVPLSIQPDTYNGQPLMYAAIASQKNHMAIYLTGVYAHEPTRKKLVQQWKQSGGRLDMGKSCFRFRTIDDVPLDALGAAIAAFSVDEFIQLVSKVQRR